MQPATLVIPMPPSANRLWRSDRGRRPHKSAGYTAWFKEAGWALKAQAPLPRFKGDVTATLSLGPRRTNADLDNRAKAVLDLLAEHDVIENDKHVTDLRLRWDDEVRGCQIDLEAAP